MNESAVDGEGHDGVGVEGHDGVGASGVGCRMWGRWTCVDGCGEMKRGSKISGHN